MPGKQSSILNFFKRTRKNFEQVQDTDDEQEASSPLGPARSEQWPWMSTAETARPQTAPEPVKTTRNLRAARSESWPWATEAPVEDSQTNYMDVLQSASQRGYQAPPRLEVQQYQSKQLPAPPPMHDSNTSSQRSSVITNSRQPTMPSSRVSLALNPDNTDEHEAQIYQSELVSPQLKWQTKNHIVSSQESTWVSRLSSRAEYDKKGRELLVKKEAQPDIPEHGE